MCNCLPKRLNRLSPLIAVSLGVCGTGRIAAQMVDLNGNGMSDIWEWLYGAVGLDPNADTDGDGMNNRSESIAGTNPFDSNSVPKISVTALSSTNASVSMPSALGKQYQLQSLQVLASSSNWITDASVIARTRTVGKLSSPAG